MILFRYDGLNITTSDGNIIPADIFFEILNTKRIENIIKNHDNNKFILHKVNNALKLSTTIFEEKKEYRNICSGEKCLCVAISNSGEVILRRIGKKNKRLIHEKSNNIMNWEIT